jgi:hypothetical protein
MAACSSPTPAPHPTASSAPPASTPAPQETNAQGDIPDNQQFVTYAVPSGAAHLKVPEGWARTDLPGGEGAVFTDKLNTIRIHLTAAASAPTPASVRAEVVASGAPAPTMSTVTRTAGTAILARYRAKSAVDPVTNKYVNDDVERYVFFRAGRTALVVLSAPVGSDNVDPWRTVTDSFGWS